MPSTIYKFSLLLTTFFFLSFLFVPKVYAATVELTVNGGGSAAVVNGESVLLEWYIDGSVSNCVINNGVGPIDTSSLPTSGSLTVTPPEGSSTTYSLTCSGGSSSAVVATNPIVTIDLNDPVEELDRLTGEAQMILSWESRYATQCSKVWLEEVSNPGVLIWTADTSDTYETSGVITFDNDNSQPALTEDTTFYIECENVVTGASTIASETMTVTNPTVLPAPTIDIQSTRDAGATTVTRDPITAMAWISLDYDSNYTDECSFEAYYLDGTPYADLPNDFERYGRTTDRISGQFYWVEMYESTRFEVTCTQFAYTIGGANYPEVSVTDDIVITVDPALPLDRTGIPPVTITATPVENSIETDPITGYGQAVIRVQTTNAESCDYWSITRATSDPTSAYVSSRADGWWGQYNAGNKDDYITVNLDQGYAFLSGRCERTFDIENYNPGDPEYEAAYAETTVMVEVLESTEPAPSVETFIYGNAVYFDSWYMWDNSISRSGFSVNSGFDQDTDYDSSLRSSNGSITFPFTSPDKVTDQYDLIVKYCDENDGFIDYELETAGGFSAAWRSDSTSQESSWCSGNSVEVTKIIGTDVTLTDGESITISCNDTADPTKGDECTLMGLAVGQNDGVPIEVEVDSDTGFATVPIFWGSQFADDCSNPTATTQSGASYAFYPNSPPDRFTLNDISTTTTFSITCDRGGDEASDSIEIRVLGPDEVTSETTVEASDCYDASLPGVREAEPWEWANPSNGNACEPAFDLTAFGPSISFSTDVTPNNIAGTYDDLSILFAIQNLGPGPLSSGNAVQYLSRLNIQPSVATLFGVTEPVETLSTPAYSDGLAEPPDDSSPSLSPVLTRTYNDVPFGEHTLCARVNIDDSDAFILDEWNSDASNNDVCVLVNLPVPRPPMSLTGSRVVPAPVSPTPRRLVIRSGQTAEIGWSVHTSYPLNCSVVGPGGVNVSFDASTNDPVAVTDVQITNPLSNTSTYELQCNEPITDTTFTEELIVEVIPTPQEI